MRILLLTALALAVLPTAPASAGRLVATGHDADLHCTGGSQCGFVKTAVDYVRSGAPDPAKPVLILDRLDFDMEVALDNAYGPGVVPRQVVDPRSPEFQTLVLSTSTYSAILVASDTTCGGCDLNEPETPYSATRASATEDSATPDSDAINLRKDAIAAFFNAGGGLYANSGADHGDGNPDNGPDTYYGFLPLPVGGQQVAAPFCLTAAGRAIGFQDAVDSTSGCPDPSQRTGTRDDINCCATHNSFQEPPAGSSILVAERDANNAPETLIAEGVASGGTIVTPATGAAPVVAAPVAATGAAAQADNDSATLRGTVRPNGSVTTWFFEYGRTTSYGRRTPTQTIPATTAEVPVSAEVSDLDSNSTYHYRLVAQNAAGTVTGPDRVFDTRKTRLSDLPRPVLGTTANVDPVKGKVFVSVPPRAGATRRLIEGPLAAAVPGLKGRSFIPLSEARQIPMGSLLDTRKGTVRVATARDRAARVQSAKFLDGVFQVLQSRARKAKGLTELRLKGSSFSRCRTVGRGKGSRGSGVEALASAGRTIRRLRGSGRGRFRTRGRRSAATVKGTIWTVSDRCDGTLTTVTRGRVAVRDFRRKKTIIVRAGKKYLAR